MSWPLVKLSDVAQVNPRCPRDIDLAQSVSFVAMASASERGFLLDEETRLLSETKKGFTYFERPDVLLAKITPCFENGKCLRPNQISHLVGFGSTEFHVIRADEEKVDSTYLFYMLWNQSFRFIGEKSMSGAAGQKRISANFLKQHEIPLPPLAEQKRIAATLDKADSIRRKRQRAIQLADEILQAVFLEMFGESFTNEGYVISNKKKIRELVDYIDYRGKTPKKSESGVPLITAKNVKKGFISEEPREFIPEKNYLDWMTRGLPKEGDVLFTTEAPLGNAALLGYYDQVVVGQRLIALRTKGELTQEYLLYCLLNRFIQDEIYKRSSGSTVKGIRTKELYEIELPIPDIKLQEKFSKVFKSSVQNNKRLAEAAIESDSMYNSLSQRAFAGSL